MGWLDIYNIGIQMINSSKFIEILCGHSFYLRLIVINVIHA